MKPDPIRRKEQIREAALRFLADRSSHKFPVEEIARRIRDDGSVDGGFDEADLEDALALLCGYGLVARVDRPLSGLYDHQATAQGVLFRERNYGR